MNWWYQLDGSTRGPVQGEVIAALVQEEILSSHSPVIAEGYEQWATVAQYASMLGIVQGPDSRYYRSQSPSQEFARTSTSGPNGMAIASVVLGALWLYWLGSILALVFGYIAKSQMRAAGEGQEGAGLATAGIVLGWIGVAILMLGVVAGTALA